MRNRRIKMYYLCCGHCYHIGDYVKNRHTERCRNDNCARGHMQGSADYKDEVTK